MSVKKKPLLLMVNGSQFGHSAGHYYYCKYLIEEYNIEYVCFDRGLKKIELEGVYIHYVPYSANRIKRTYSFISLILRKNREIKADINHVVYFNFCFLVGLLLRHGLKIVDIRTGALDTSLLRRRINNTIIKLQSSFFNKRIILSDSLRKKLRIKTTNTLILPLGAEILYKDGHDFDTLHLLYVGSLDGRKIEITIEGLKIFLNKYSLSKRLKYTIVGFGSPEIETKILSSIKALELQNHVEFVGRKPYNELESYFRNANVGVSFVPITDFYNAQPPTKTYEYILNGLFTIGTATYENKLIINPSNGVLCEDNAESFAKALNEIQSMKRILNSETIRMTLYSCTWNSLVKNKLIPFIQS